MAGVSEGRSHAACTPSEGLPSDMWGMVVGVAHAKLRKGGPLLDLSLDLLPALLRGAEVTVKITVISAALSAVIAFAAGLARLSRYRLIRAVAAVYVEFFRGTSLVVQLFWLYFALPLLGIRLSAMVAAVLALSLNFGAYGSEVVRGTIQAVPRGQREAAISLNMTANQTMRRIILPQALPMMMPAFGNQLIELLKSTALVSLITISDMTFQGVTLRTSTLRTAEVFTWLLVLYFLMAYALTLGMKQLERRMSAGRP